MKRRPPRNTPRDRGAAAVEFALLLPLLLLLVFGIIDFGRALNAQITLTQAAREGARLDALGQPNVVSRTQAAATGLNPVIVAVTACPVNAGAGVNAVVQASFRFTFVTPVARDRPHVRFEPRAGDNAQRHGSHALRDLILRPASACLARRLTGLRDDGGRGAIGVLVAILIGAGVLFGMAALVIDVGQIYQNRAELQNGADAAALAVAKSCAQGTCTPSIASQYASANASRLTGGQANVSFACGATGVSGTVPVGSGICPVAAVKNSARRTPRPGRTTSTWKRPRYYPTARLCCRPSSPERSPAPTRAAPCTPARRPNGAVR